MKKYIGKKVNLHILKEGNDLYYDCVITSVNDSHINFIDKFKKSYTFKVKFVEEIVQK